MPGIADNSRRKALMRAAEQAIEEALRQDVDPEATKWIGEPPVVWFAALHLRAMADKMTEEKQTLTLMPEWLDRQIANVETTIAAWPQSKRESAGICSTRVEGEGSDRPAEA